MRELIACVPLCNVNRMPLLLHRMFAFQTKLSMVSIWLCAFQSFLCCFFLLCFACSFVRHSNMMIDEPNIREINMNASMRWQKPNRKKRVYVLKLYSQLDEKMAMRLCRHSQIIKRMKNDRRSVKEKDRETDQNEERIPNKLLTTTRITTHNKQ